MITKMIGEMGEMANLVAVTVLLRRRRIVGAMRLSEGRAHINRGHAAREIDK